jgi:hypothetical protein
LIINMARRRTVNRTGLSRIEGIAVHDAFVGFICLKCHTLNHVRVGEELLDPESAFSGAEWPCKRCGYVHRRRANLPFPNWPRKFRQYTALPAERFWLGFFRIATEHPDSYWKQCNACGRILPVRILDHSEAVVAVNHFSVGAARAAQRKVLEGIIN